MSITECNYEEEIKKLRLIECEDAHEKGLEEGHEEGLKEGIEIGRSTNKLLIEQVQKKLTNGKNIELIAAELEQPVIIIQKCIDEMNNK